MEEEKIASVPYYIHEAVCDKMERTSEAALSRMETSNRRMMVSLIVVCLTLIVTVCSFLCAYKKMNDTWMSFLRSTQQEEVQNDIYEGDAGANPESFAG